MKAPLVTCLLDGGWAAVVGVAVRVVARGKRKMKVDSSPVVGFEEGVIGGRQFALYTANGNHYVFKIDGTFEGYTPHAADFVSATDYR